MWPYHGDLNQADKNLDNIRKLSISYIKPACGSFISRMHPTL